MTHILLIEDDPNIADIISFYLSKDPQYELHWAAQASMAYPFLKEFPIEIILLDIMLPDANGIDLCYELRKTTYCPILFISCLDSESTIIRALQLGGDDYLVKPFSGEMLLTKIRIHLRRSQYRQSQTPATDSGNQSGTLSFSAPPSTAVLIAGNIRLDLNRHELTKNSVEIKTSPTELEIVAYLMQNQGRVVTQEELYQAIWKRPSYGDLRTISVHISNLRKKMEDDPNNPHYIKTVRSAGYLFNTMSS